MESKNIDNEVNRLELDNIILNEFPTPIAFLYNEILATTNWSKKVNISIKLFESCLKLVVLQVVFQYFNRDHKELMDESLNNILHFGFAQSHLGHLVGILFATVNAYKDNIEKLYIPELNSLIINQFGKKKKSPRKNFLHLVGIRNDIHHGKVNPIKEDDWKKVYLELEEHLLRVLKNFIFFKYYKLVYIIAETPSYITGKLFSGKRSEDWEINKSDALNLKTNEFYLVDTRVNKFLQLHPLFLPWPSELFQQIEIDDLNPSQSHLTFLNSFSGENNIIFSINTFSLIEKLVVENAELKDEFSKLVFDVLKNFKEKFYKARSISWQVFIKIAKDISEIGMENVLDKFSQDLYYPRSTMLEMFDNFLKSKQIGFILLGKSGVGKSSFLLSLMKKFSTDENHHMIFINGAKLTGNEKIGTLITSYFSRKLIITQNNRNINFDNIFDELNKIKDIDNKRIIIAIDAINESSDPQMLIQKIDDFLSFENYPWLKVVITSRPFTWFSLKNYTNLNDSNYYISPDTLTIEFELQKFDESSIELVNWHKLHTFNQEELPNVYKLYKKAYDLQSEFVKLSPDIKLLLRDPLALRLVSETYHKGPIPPSIHKSDLYIKYIDSLIDQKKLDPLDIDVFLKQKILPLMFAEGNYLNQLTSSILRLTIDPLTNQPLAEKVEYSDIVPSTQRRINQEFRNLANADILIQQGTPREYTISFKYERFYDYFGGEYLFGKVRGKNLRQKVNHYSNLISSIINEYPFLWGPVKMALFNEAYLGDFKLIAKLISSGNSTTIKLLERVLVTYAIDFPTQGKQILNHLYSLNNRTSKLVAIRVSGESGISSILERAGIQFDGQFRSASIKAAYRLWQIDNNKGWSLLNAWSTKVSFPLGILVVKSILYVSLLILTDPKNTSLPGSGITNYQNSEIVNNLQKVWKQVISKLLLTSEKRKFIGIYRLFQDVGISILLDALLFILNGRSTIRGAMELNPLDVLNTLFDYPQEKRKNFLQMREYFYEPGVDQAGLEQHKKMIFDCFDPKNLVGSAAVLMFLHLWAKREGDQDLPIIESLYQNAYDPDWPTMIPSQLVFNAGLILQRGTSPPADEALEIYERMQRSHLSVGGKYFFTSELEHESSYLEMYSTTVYRKDNTISPLLLETVEKSIQEYTESGILIPLLKPETLGMPIKKDAPSLPALITQIITLSIVRDLPIIGLEIAKPIVNMLNKLNGNYSQSDKEIEKFLGFALARVRLYYQDYIDNFLEDSQAPDSLRLLVRSTILEEDIWGDHIIGRYGTASVKIIFVPAVRDFLWSLFEFSLHVSSLREYLGVALKSLINFVYDEQVFNLDRYLDEV